MPMPAPRRPRDVFSYARLYLSTTCGGPLRTSGPGGEGQQGSRQGGQAGREMAGGGGGGARLVEGARALGEGRQVDDQLRVGVLLRGGAGAGR